ncbi:hypothetical protein [Mycetohabitans endofungorum]|uniref:hypothetical protein n=1 Tax=Mycetohabitans endofungorum TaxID=417203 RepID=UPI002B051E21|nr:hypothetical protein [Mycetohabitans endofungorum]
MIISPGRFQSQLTSITVESEDIKSTIIPFRYDTLPGNQPKANKNIVYLWQTNGEEIPFHEDPQRKSMLIDSNRADNFTNFDELSLAKDSYLMAYAVANNVNAVVTTLLITGVGDGRFNVSLPEDKLAFSVAQIGSTSLCYYFCVPRGMSPKDDGDWVGLWEGSTVSELYYKKPLFSSPVLSDINSGYGGLTLPEGQNLMSGIEYILGYFKTGYKKDKKVDKEGSGKEEVKKNEQAVGGKEEDKKNNQEEGSKEDPLQTTLAAVTIFTGP